MYSVLVDFAKKNLAAQQSAHATVLSTDWKIQRSLKNHSSQQFALLLPD
jgi:hypothetical protein